MGIEGESPVGTEFRDGILVCTLRRPEARNAFDAALAARLAAAMDRLDEDDELRGEC